MNFLCGIKTTNSESLFWMVHEFFLINFLLSSLFSGCSNVVMLLVFLVAAIIF